MGICWFCCARSYWRILYYLWLNVCSKHGWQMLVFWFGCYKLFCWHPNHKSQSLQITNLKPNITDIWCVDSLQKSPWKPWSCFPLCSFALFLVALRCQHSGAGWPNYDFKCLLCTKYTFGLFVFLCFNPQFCPWMVHLIDFLRLRSFSREAWQ